MANVERQDQLPIIEVTPNLTVKDLPDTSNCEMCEGPLTKSVRTWSPQTDRFIIRAENVPVLNCENEDCGAGWLTDEVSLDVFSQAVPLLREFGDYEGAQHYEAQVVDLRERIAARA